jgi:hypothetical protein
MTTHTDVVDRLRRTADRIEVTGAGFDAVTSGEQRSRRATRSRPGLLVAALVATSVLTGSAIVALSLGSHGPDIAPRTDPVPAATDMPEPGSLVAHVEDPPGWITGFTAGRRAGGQRLGTWTAGAVAEVTDDGYSRPVLIAVADGSWSVLDDASTIRIDGRDLRIMSIGGWTAVATTRTPMVVASGRVESSVLTQIIDAATVVDGVRFQLDGARLPSGFEVIVGARELARDTTLRHTLADQSGRIAVNEVSDWVDPLLSAAATGADLVRHDLDGAVGWSGRTEHPSGPIAFVVWSPARGVVFEVDSTDPTRSLDDLLDLASRTEIVTAERFDELYGS